MYWLQSRYYDPEIGRFINADDANVLDESNHILGTNLFAYCANNPLMYVDYTGKSFTLAIVGGAALIKLMIAGFALITAAVILSDPAVQRALYDLIGASNLFVNLLQKL